MSKYIIIIHGGNSFKNYGEYTEYLKNSIPSYRNNYSDWKANLIETISPEFTLLQPKMPNSDNVQYSEWEIVIDKILGFLPDNRELILVGHSLGANFWSLYLKRKQIKHKILQLHLVAGCLSEGDFKINEDWELINSQSSNKQVYIWHSTDDGVVDYSQALIYSNKLTNSHLQTFGDRGHFNGPHFNELVNVINKLA